MVTHHLIIAGTGRAGTSFLVQYLAACGLDTHLSRYPGDRKDEMANAGLEDLPFGDSDLPYVIKTPWLYEFVDRLLDREDVTIDAILVPMRDIVEAASSRVTIELQARYRNPHLLDEQTAWETWATTPGGMIYAINPVDQARVLALGFQQVLHAAVKRDVPIILLDFPRIVEDGEYLFRKLGTVLVNVSQEAAAIAHRQAADRDGIRVGRELRNDSAHPMVPLTFPAAEQLDRSAMLRELRSSQKQQSNLAGELRACEERTKALLQRQEQEHARQIAASEARQGTIQAELNATRAQFDCIKETIWWRLGAIFRR